MTDYHTDSIARLVARGETPEAARAIVERLEGALTASGMTTEQAQWWVSQDITSSRTYGGREQHA